MGIIDPDDPRSWRQSKDFPVTQAYEITFRGLMKLNLRGRGVTEPERLGTMGRDDQTAFEEARPNDVLRYADTGANISLTRSFDFADHIAGKAPAKGKSNLIVVQIVRPGYGIDVEQNAYDEEERGVAGITPLNRQKAREAREIATLRNPVDLIMGWVQIDRGEEDFLGEAEPVATYIRNPAFRLPGGQRLQDMRNYGEYRRLLGKYDT